MSRYFLIAVFVLRISASQLLWARIPVSPGDEDIRDLADHAPLVFRGQVVQLHLTKREPGNKEGIAVIAVDRWYRGGRVPVSSRINVHFAYDWEQSFQGHNCVDLVLDSHWIFFAQPDGAAAVELSHDCEGALAVSLLLAPQESGRFLSQIQADFRAGLSDSDPEARIASIQRLAGLGLPSSREALHEVIAHGTEAESKWALFAALKTGDVSVLSLAVPILLNLRHVAARSYRQPDGMVVTTSTPYPQPDAGIALAIEKLRAPEAVPSLIEILNEAPDELVRSCASQALMEIRDPRALDAFADHLSDPSQYVRYNSLIGMEYITHSPACTIRKPEDAEKAEPLCRGWWKSRY
jgi:HEAT repeat protein